MGSLKKIILGEESAEPDMIFFFKDPHIFPYYPSKCLHNEFILPMILPEYRERHKHDFKHILNSFCLHYRLELCDVIM